MISFFKNKDTETGSFNFANTRYYFDGVFLTDDKELAKYLDKATNWENVTPCESEFNDDQDSEFDEIAEPKPKKATKKAK